MSLRFQVSHPEQLVVGVSTGVVTLKDLLTFWHELETNKVLSYHKIVDVMGGTPMLSEFDMAAFRDKIAELAKREKLGPLAIVTNPQHEDLATMFSQLTSEQRPVKVFHSIHAARKWLHTMPHKR